MMKIKKLNFLGGIILAICTMVGPAQAQELKSFTLEDLNFGGNNYHNMVVKNRYLEWWGDQLIRLDAEDCKLIDKNTGKEKQLFTLSDIKKRVMRAYRHSPSIAFIIPNSHTQTNHTHYLATENNGHSSISKRRKSYGYRTSAPTWWRSGTLQAKPQPM